MKRFGRFQPVRGLKQLGQVVEGDGTRGVIRAELVLEQRHGLAQQGFGLGVIAMSSSDEATQARRGPSPGVAVGGVGEGKRTPEGGDGLLVPGRLRVAAEAGQGRRALQYRQFATLDALLPGLREHGIVVARRQRQALARSRGDSAASCTRGAIFVSMIC